MKLICLERSLCDCLTISNGVTKCWHKIVANFSCIFAVHTCLHVIYMKNTDIYI